MNKSLFFTLILSLLSSSLQASWSEGAIKFAKKYESRFKHAYLDTLHGVCGLSKYKKSKIQGELEKLSLHLPTYFKDELPAYLVIQKDGKVEKKAPLLVVFPGSFTNLDEDQAVMWMQLFSELGYHTLLLPNPWSTDFVQAESNFLLGDFQDEAESLAFATKEIFKDLKRRNLLSSNDLQIFGLSHGAFIASIVNYLMTKDNFKINKTTLVSPALNLNNSFLLLDKHIEDSLQMSSQEESRSLLSSLFSFLKICKSQNIEELSPKVISKSKYLAAIEGFQKDLATTLIAYNKVQDLNIIPKDSEAKKRWKENLKYSDFFKQFAPSLLPLYKSEKSQVKYWISKAENLGVKNVRILVSDNDFINNYPELRSSGSILKLQGGGHFGFCATEWFENFLKITF